LTVYTMPHYEKMPRRSRLIGLQRQICHLIAARLTDAEIARKLGLQLQTVKGHVCGIRCKLGVSSRLEIVIWWVRSTYHATDKARCAEAWHIVPWPENAKEPLPDHSS